MIYILLDSSIYKSENFRFEQGFLGFIKRLALDKKIKLLTHPIIQKEVEKLIFENSNEFASTFKKSIRKITSLSYNDKFKFLFSLNERKVGVEINNLFLNFYKDIDPLVLTLNGNLNKIVEDYFDSNPPFHSNKKKNEFPDALILDSLKNHKFKEDDAVYVFAKDNDWASYFAQNKLNNIQFLGGIENLLKVIPDESYFRFYDESLNTWLNSQEQKNKLLRMLNSEFHSKSEYFNETSKFYNKDIEFDNSDIICFSNANCIYINKDNKELAFDIKFTTKVDFLLSHINFDNAHWDEKTASYHNVHQGYYNFRGEVQGVAVVLIDIEVDKQSDNPSKEIKFSKIKLIDIFQDNISSSLNQLEITEVTPVLT